QVDLVDGDDHVPDAQAGDDGEVASGLFGRPVAGVDEDDDGIGGRGTGDHVPGVLHMAGAVGEDERAAVGGDGAGGEVDGDGLFGRPVAGVDEDDDGIGGRGTGDHVPGVLHMAGAVGEDERAAVGGEVAVGDVDGDALFAFGPQTVGEQGEVELPAEESAFGAGGGHGFELVGQDRLRIMEQSAHQGGFAVVDGPGGGEAQQRLRLCR